MIPKSVFTSSWVQVSSKTRSKAYRISFVFLPPAIMVLEYCAMGFSSGGSNTSTRSSRTWTIRRIAFVDSFVWGVAVREPSPIHNGESLMDVTNGSSLLLNGLTRTVRQHKSIKGMDLWLELNLRPSWKQNNTDPKIRRSRCCNFCKSIPTKTKSGLTESKVHLRQSSSNCPLICWWLLVVVDNFPLWVSVNKPNQTSREGHYLHWLLSLHFPNPGQVRFNQKIESRTILHVYLNRARALIDTSHSISFHLSIYIK